MNYLSKLDEQEIFRLCEAIPFDVAKYYFKRYPKDFAKIFRGFRVKTLSEAKVHSILKQNYKNDYISWFLENNLRRWIGEIKDEIEKEKANNKTDFVAHVTTLSVSFLGNNVSAYFKLVESNYTEEQVKLIDEMVTEMAETNKLIDKLKKCVEEDQKAIEVLSEDLEVYERERALNKRIKTEKKQLEKKISKCEDELCEKDKEIVHLKAMNKQLEQEKSSFVAKTKDLKAQIKESEQKNFDLLKEISEGKYQKKLSLENIEEEVEVLAPKDSEEFIDILSSNFISIGLNSEFRYPNMLSDFIYKGICVGKPFVIKRTVANCLIKCLSNTITGSQSYDTLSYEPSITESDIVFFLQESQRIILLDNFIGNYNETLLLSILEKFKNKIVFISTTYENALRYVSEEFFEYITFLSVSDFNCFEKIIELDEDPYECDEIIVYKSTLNNIYSKRIDRIISEMVSSLCIRINGNQFVTDDSSLAGYLYFSLMPYCEMILGVNPFNYSKTLQKFFAENGRSTYKDIFKRWY